MQSGTSPEYKKSMPATLQAIDNAESSEDFQQIIDKINTNPNFTDQNKEDLFADMSKAMLALQDSTLIKSLAMSIKEHRLRSLDHITLSERLNHYCEKIFSPLLGEEICTIDTKQKEIKHLRRVIAKISAPEWKGEEELTREDAIAEIVISVITGPLDHTSPLNQFQKILTQELINLIENYLSASTDLERAIELSKYRAILYRKLREGCKETEDAYKAALLFNDAQNNYGKKEYSNAITNYKESFKLIRYPLCGEMFLKTSKAAQLVAKSQSSLVATAAASPKKTILSQIEAVQAAEKAFTNNQFNTAHTYYKLACAMETAQLAEEAKQLTEKEKIDIYKSPIAIKSMLQMIQKTPTQEKNLNYYTVSNELLDILIKYIESSQLKIHLDFQQESLLTETCEQLYQAYTALLDIQKATKKCHLVTETKKLRTEHLLRGQLAHTKKQYTEALEAFYMTQSLSHLDVCNDMMVRTTKDMMRAFQANVTNEASTYVKKAEALFESGCYKEAFKAYTLFDHRPALKSKSKQEGMNYLYQTHYAFVKSVLDVINKQYNVFKKNPTQPEEPGYRATSEDLLRLALTCLEENLLPAAEGDQTKHSDIAELKSLRDVADLYLLRFYEPKTTSQSKPQEECSLKSSNPKDIIRQAEQAMTAGKFDTAIKFYKNAQTLEVAIINEQKKQPKALIPSLQKMTRIILDQKNKTHYDSAEKLLILAITHIENIQLPFNLDSKDEILLLETLKQQHACTLLLHQLYLESNNKTEETSKRLTCIKLLVDGQTAHKNYDYDDAIKCFNKAAIASNKPNPICALLSEKSKKSLALLHDIEKAKEKKQEDEKRAQEEALNKATKEATRKNEEELKKKQDADRKKAEQLSKKMALKKEAEAIRELKEKAETALRLQAEEKAREEKKPHYKIGDEITIDISDKVKEILTLIEEKGGIAFLCGSSVTDAIAKQFDKNSESKDTDYDIVTNIDPTHFIKCTHLKQLESRGITSFRIDDVIPPIDITFSKALTVSLKEDALKRDLNLKSFYADRKGKVYDPLAAIPHLINKQLETNKPPLESFEEDPIRILRAIDTAIKMKLPLSKAIKDAVITCAPALAKEDPKLLTLRLTRLLDHGCIRERFNLMYELSLIKSIFPALNESSSKYASWLDSIFISPPKNCNLTSLELFYLGMITAYQDHNPQGKLTDAPLIFEYFYVNTDHRNPTSKKIPGGLKILQDSLASFKEHTNRIKFLNSSFSLFGSSARQVPCQLSYPALPPLKL